MGFKILHITDFHFVSDEDKEAKYKNITERIQFHDKLRNYIVSEFSGKINYLLLTGDFGDRGKSCNIQFAKRWLENLHKELQIPSSNIIFCPGNHDINSELIPAEHYIARTDHAIGQDYLFSSVYNDSIFDQYSKDIPNVSGNSELLAVFREFEEVRFIVLNSSWLSQANNEALKKFEQKIIEDIKAGNTNTYQELAEQFGGVFFEREDIIFRSKEGDEKLAFLPGLLNLSENKTQQLGFFKSKEIIEAIQALDSSKINVLVFHHPETHLHPFERNYIKDAQGTGFYKFLCEKCHLLICGHTHPIEAEDINNNYYHNLPNFVGGGAHLQDHGTNDRPFFYCYEVDNSSGKTAIEIRRDIYLYQDGQFCLAGKEKEKSGLKDITVIDLNTTKSFAGRNFNSYVAQSDNNKSYNSLKAKMRCYINDGLLFELKKVDKNFQLFETGRFIKLPKAMKRPDVNSATSQTRNMYIKETRLCSSVVSIDFDVIFTDELDFGPERECVAIRLQRGFDGAGKGNIYYPLFIDPLSCLLVEGYRENYEDLLKKKIEYFLSKNKILIPRFDQQIPDFYNQLDNVGSSGPHFSQELRIIRPDELMEIESVNYSSRYGFCSSS